MLGGTAHVVAIRIGCFLAGFAGVLHSSVAKAEEPPSVNVIRRGLDLPQLERLRLPEPPDLAVAKSGLACPYGVHVVASGAAIASPFVVRLGLYSITDGEKLHRRTLSVTVTAAPGASYVKFPFSPSMLGADRDDPIECVVVLDADNRIKERSESNNTATILTSLLAADERQGQ